MLHMDSLLVVLPIRIHQRLWLHGWIGDMIQHLMKQGQPQDTMMSNASPYVWTNRTETHSSLSMVLAVSKGHTYERVHTFQVYVCT